MMYSSFAVYLSLYFLHLALSVKGVEFAVLVYVFEERESALQESLADG